MSQKLSTIPTVDICKPSTNGDFPWQNIWYDYIPFFKWQNPWCHLPFPSRLQGAGWVEMVDDLRFLAAQNARWHCKKHLGGLAANISSQYIYIYTYRCIYIYVYIHMYMYRYSTMKKMTFQPSIFF